MRTMRRRQGFTLIELSLSLVFIAVLSLIVALLTNNMVLSYRRGLTLKQINATGMDLVSDMKTAIQNSPTGSVIKYCDVVYNDAGMINECKEKRGEVLVSFNRTAKVHLSKDKTIEEVPVVGGFCTGTYSYLWNSGYFFTVKSGSYPEIEGASEISLKYAEGKEIKDFRLLKVRDPNRAVCVVAANAGDELINVESGGIDGESSVDLLGNTSQYTGLAIYDLTAGAPASSSSLGGLFYSVSFILGTVQGGINVKASGNFCSTPNDYNDKSFDYCAINKFNFAARAIGG